MKTYVTIAAAVAASLTAAAASAAPLTYAQIAASTAVYLDGSSAFQTNLENQLAAIAPTTLTKFVDSLDGKSFLAYSFQVPNPAPADFTAIAGDNILLLYRLKGGSVWGPGPIAKNVAVATLAVPAVANGCPAAPALFPAKNQCTVNATYALNTDGPPPQAGLQYHVPEWGLSDVNPAALTGENWVSSTSGAGALGTSSPNYSGILGSTSAVMGQVFSIVVNKNGPAGALNSLAKQDITQILSGEAADWSQIPNAARNGTLAAGAITMCRRDAGSGTQTLASVFFNGTNCSSASYAFPLPNGTTVIQNNSTGNLLTCVNGNNNAIGFAVLDSTQAVMTNNGGNVKIMGYDGNLPTKTNAASGTYEYYAESSSTTNPGLAAGVEKTFITAMVARLQDVNNVAASDSLIAIPGAAAANTPSLPLTAVGGTPVAIGTTSGNVCLQVQSQL